MSDPVGRMVKAANAFHAAKLEILHAEKAVRAMLRQGCPCCKGTGCVIPSPDPDSKRECPNCGPEFLAVHKYNATCCEPCLCQEPVKHLIFHKTHDPTLGAGVVGVCATHFSQCYQGFAAMCKLIGAIPWQPDPRLKRLLELDSRE